MADATVVEWLLGQATRVASRQRAQVDSAKLVVTFAAGVAATLTATALQVGPPTGLDLAAAVVLGMSLVAALGVIARDRILEPDHNAALEQAHLHGWEEARLVSHLQEITLASSYFNEDVVDAVRRLAVVQVFLAVASAMVAAVSLLLGGGGLAS